MLDGTLEPIVALALVNDLDTPTHFFAASRSYPSELRGLFEFPGGKVEPGEDLTDALHREIREELGVDIILGAPILNNGLLWWPLDNGRPMAVWTGALVNQEPTLGDGHIEGRWIPTDPSALKIPWIRANLPIVEALIHSTSHK